MAKITVLPPEVVSKIAAGEVIERPASVVKELLENALDAGADTVTVHLEQAGKKLIRIRDNGCGISGDDLKNVFVRHATSKLKSIDDLNAIASLGFRGEALYSIAAIADVTLRSKTAGSQTGWEIHARGGNVLSLKPIPFTPGTELQIKELFFNTPARKKFLKSDSAELNQIISIVDAFTLLHPEHRFEVKHRGKSLIDLIPCSSRKERIAKSLKLKPANLLEASRSLPDRKITVSLICGDINIQRARKDMQYLFINDRPVVNRTISFHLNEAYKHIFPPGIYPFFCAFLTIPPEQVDANVHPTKREVKITDEREIALRLRALCEETLLTQSTAKEAAQRIFTLPDTPTDTHAPAPSAKNSFHTPRGVPLNEEQHRLLFDDTSLIPLKTSAQPLIDLLKHAPYIGSFRRKYLLFDAHDSLLLMDQHAAAERITYEKLLRQVEIARVEIDTLLSPVLLNVTTQEMILWEELKEKLDQIGFSTTSWDTETLAIHAHPRLIRNPEHAMRILLTEREILHADMDTITRRACRESVMTGDMLHTQEAQNLRKELLACKDPFTCPHGRPTVIEIKESQINKQFLR